MILLFTSSISARKYACLPDIFRGHFRRNRSITLEIHHAPIFSIGKKKSSIDRRAIISGPIIGWSERVEEVEPCASSARRVDHGISHININRRLILSLLKPACSNRPSTQQDSKSHPRELPNRSSWIRYRRGTAPMTSFSCRQRTSSP